MASALRLAMVASIFTHVLFAQINEADLRRSYPITGDGLFVLGSGAKMKAVFDKHGEACTFTLQGELSEGQVFALFYALVPLKTRGFTKVGRMMECVGRCLQSEVYEHVALVTGVVGKQTSEPAAIITFSRAECKAAVAEASKTVLKIR